jgi:hypothetical protein
MALSIECCYAESRCAECRGAMPNLIFVGQANGTMALSITTLIIKSLFVTLGINDIQHK